LKVGISAQQLRLETELFDGSGQALTDLKNPFVKTTAYF